MFPPELERDAFRADHGEFGWTRAQIPLVVDVLRSHGMGILGGELWWVRDESTRWDGLVPPWEVSYQCHMNCDEWRQKVNKDRKEKVNLTTPIARTC